jgi:hypothetical protein
MKQDKAFDPLQIRLLSPNAVVFGADDGPHLIEQAGLARRRAVVRHIGRFILRTHWELVD